MSHYCIVDPRALTGCSVLVVEDDPDIRECVKEVLESEGFRVGTAANGVEALASLRANPHPCVILLDLMMPVMDGWTFCEEQQRDPLLALIPVVVVSAAPNLAERGSSPAVVSRLTKPVDIPLLLGTIERICGHAA